MRESVFLVAKLIPRKRAYMFSVSQKREIADKIQQLLRETGHPELPEEEIQFEIRIKGAEPWSWACVKNNGAVENPGVNLWNELQEKSMQDNPLHLKG